MAGTYSVWLIVSIVLAAIASHVLLYVAITDRAARAVRRVRAACAEEIERIAAGRDALEAELARTAENERDVSDSAERYRRLVELSPDAIIIQTANAISYVNPAAVELLGGTSAAEFTGQPLLRFFHPERRGELKERLRQAAQEQKALPVLEERMMGLDFRTIDVEVTACAFVQGGEPGVQMVLREMTERNKAAEEIRKTQAFLTSVVDNIPHMIFVKDAHDLTFVHLNRVGQELLGYSEEEVRGRTDFDLFPRAQAELYARKDREALTFVRRVAVSEETLAMRDGTERAMRTKKLPILGSDGRPRYLLGIAEDVTDRKLYEERLAYLAQYDALTGLPNRALFKERLSSAMTRARRNREMLALVSVDLDRFKEINDSLGHRVGDEVLKVAAERFSRVLRSTDTVSRLGGDEFTIMLEDVGSDAHARSVVEQLQGTLVEPIVVDGREIFISASIGISLFPANADEFDTLLQTADIAMYHAKEMGRNTYEFYAPQMNAQAAAHLKMQNLLRRALARDELTLLYQPKVDIATNEIVGVEALIRWSSKELGCLLPDRFIPLAEEAGLIVPIGEWLIRAACAQNKAWQRKGLPRITVSVNLSPRQFRQPNLPEVIAAALCETALDPALLELEITENTVMHHADKAAAMLAEIHALGVQISVDDFGTGYSSLAYLKRFPVNKLKIDQSFVRDLTSDADDQSIVAALIAMAKSLNLGVIAEGVETSAQLDLLRTLGCEEYQGFHFSRPLTPEELEPLLQLSAGMKSEESRGLKLAYTRLTPT